MGIQTGLRHVATATKVTQHGQLCVEDGFVGKAFKSASVGTYVDPRTAAVREIAVGEQFVIQINQSYRIKGSRYPGGAGAATVGDTVYITTADNTLNEAAGAGRVPVGRVSEVRDGFVLINTLEKGSI